MKIRIVKCKNPSCKKEFQQRRFNQIVCSPLCSIEYQKLLKSKKEAKEWRDKKAVMKEKLMNLSNWKKLLEKQVNTICRLIDKDCKCISCNGKGNQAGHFHSVQSNESIRFNLHNLHVQEFNCNVERGGNVLAYSSGLINTFGNNYQEYCMFTIVKDYPLIKLDKNDIISAIELAKQSIKELKEANKTYSPELRVKLRDYYNHKIGIYNKSLK